MKGRVPSSRSARRSGRAAERRRRRSRPGDSLLGRRIPYYLEPIPGAPFILHKVGRSRRHQYLLGAFRVHAQQKTSAAIADIGMKEMTRLRKRVHGYVPDAAEVHVHVAPYLMRHLACHAMYRAGLTRY